MTDSSPTNTVTIDTLHTLNQGFLPDLLGIEFIELTPQRVVARMSVTQRVQQPYGVLHGGASVVLAETLASTGSWLNIDSSRYTTVGLEINANHIRGRRDGVVTGTATPLHIGRTTQVWEIKITDEQDKLVCISRCTLAIIPVDPEIAARVTATMNTNG